MQEKVYDYLTKIPKGKVVTYGQIADYLGNKNLSRVVGNILHKNKEPIKYPCYKVVNQKGELSKHYAFGGIERQKDLLELDGIVINNYKVNLSIYQMKENI